MFNGECKKLASFYSLVHDDTNGVVEKTLAKNNRIEFWVDLVLLKDGQDSDRIRSREGRAEYQALQ